MTELQVCMEFMMFDWIIQTSGLMNKLISFRKLFGGRGGGLTNNLHLLVLSKHKCVSMKQGGVCRHNRFNEWFCHAGRNVFKLTIAVGSG